MQCLVEVVARDTGVVLDDGCNLQVGGGEGLIEGDGALEFRDGGAPPGVVYELQARLVERFGFRIAGAHPFRRGSGACGDTDGSTLLGAVLLGSDEHVRSARSEAHTDGGDPSRPSSSARSWRGRTDDRVLGFDTRAPTVWKRTPNPV